MRSIALVAAVVVALVCANGALAAPTRSEFIRKGDVLCTQTARELVPIRRRAQTAKTLPLSQQWAAAADIWADQIAIQRRFVSHFRALGTPASDRPAQRLVAGLARGVTLAVRVQEGFCGA